MLAPGAQGGAADLSQVVAALRRRVWTVLAVTALCLGLAIAYLAVAKPQYSAWTSILIDARLRPPIGSDQQPAPNSPDLALIDSQQKLISSEAVLRRVVESENLDRDPEFAPDGVGLRRRIMQMVGLARANPEVERSDKILQAISSLAQALSTRRSERTYVIDLEVTSLDPSKAARLANAIARAYVEDIRGAATEQAKRNAEWINARVAELQGKVEQSERKIADFRARNGLIDANGKWVNEQDLTDFASQLTAARNRASESKARYDQTRKIAESGLTPDGLGDAARSAALDKLRGQLAEIQRQESNYRATLGPRHPAYIEVQQQLSDTRNAIRAEARRLVDVARTDLAAAREQEAAAARRVEAAKGQNSLDGKSMIELRELERDVAASRSAYERFLRARETVREDVSEGPTARIISAATTPVQPTSPKKFAILALALAGGLGLGVALALVREFVFGAKPAEQGQAARSEARSRKEEDARRAQEAVSASLAAHVAPAGETDADEQEAPGAGHRVRAPRGGGARPRGSVAASFDPASFEDGLFEAIGAAREQRRRSEAAAWSLIDAASRSAKGGPVTILVADVRERRSEGMVARVLVALAQAAAARGDRALAAPGDAGVHRDALIAEGEARSLDIEGELCPAWELESDEGGVVVLGAPEEEPARRARPLAGPDARFDVMLFEETPGRGARESFADADAVVALIGEQDGPEGAEWLERVVEQSGGVFAGSLAVPQRGRRRARQAA